jgi:hypothetical protein
MYIYIFREREREREREGGGGKEGGREGEREREREKDGKKFKEFSFSAVIEREILKYFSRVFIFRCNHMGNLHKKLFLHLERCTTSPPLVKTLIFVCVKNL